MVMTKDRFDIISQCEITPGFDFDGMVGDPDTDRLPELQWIALDMLRTAVGALEGLTPTARAEMEVAMDDLLDTIQWTVCSDGTHDRKGLAKQCRYMAGVMTKEEEE